MPATEFLTGYLIEKSLSVDNIFVFVLIFGSLNIPPVYRHRVLFWGIMTALVLRAIMIFAGVAMLQRFHWLIYVFGAFLIFTGVKLVAQWGKKEEESLKENGMLRFTRRVIPSTSRLDGNRFFTIENGRRVATPLFITLILVELSDVVFALDSIPAIFGVTQDPFIVFSSNIFAILGLRSLFFALDGMLDKFYYLKLGVSAVLVFVGAKMALVDFVKISSGLSLGVIAGLLGGCVVASLIRARRLAARGQQQPLARAG